MGSVHATLALVPECFYQSGSGVSLHPATPAEGDPRGCDPPPGGVTPGGGTPGGGVTPPQGVCPQGVLLDMV